FAVGIADDHRLHLRAAAGRDLLRVQALHGRRAHRGRGEVVATLRAVQDFAFSRMRKRLVMDASPSKWRQCFSETSPLPGPVRLNTKVTAPPLPTPSAG